MEGKRYIFGWGPATALFYAIVIFGLIVLGTVATIKWNDWFGTDLANSRTNVIRESNENVQSKQVQLINLIQQWNRLETEIKDIAGDPSRAESVATRRNQQAGIVDSMCQLKVTLPGDQLPDDVARFLATHPCTGSR